MFTPDPKKAQEPVMLLPGKTFTLHLHPNSITNEDGSNVRSPGDTRRVDLNISRTVLLAKSVRWRASDDVMVEFNRSAAAVKTAENAAKSAATAPGLPEKYFLDDRGEFNVTPGIERVSFTVRQNQPLARLYLEIA